jgi:hypothetical protein
LQNRGRASSPPRHASGAGNGLNSEWHIRTCRRQHAQREQRRQTGSPQARRVRHDPSVPTTGIPGCPRPQAELVAALRPWLRYERPGAPPPSNALPATACRLGVVRCADLPPPRTTTEGSRSLGPWWAARVALPQLPFPLSSWRRRRTASGLRTTAYPPDQSARAPTAVGSRRRLETMTG